MYIMHSVRYINNQINKFRKSARPVAVILMYHRISDFAAKPNWLAVSPDNFAQQMEHVRKSYYPIRLLDLVDAVKNRLIPPRAIAITFDDGYLDNYTRALPILESFRIPATVFVTTGYIDSQREFWWDELPRLILQSPHAPSKLSLVIQGSHFTWHTSSITERQETYLVLRDIIKPLSIPAQEEILNKLKIWSGLERVLRPEYRTMTTTELKQLAKSSYIDIGAHTMSHPILTTLSLDTQRQEIVNSRRELELILRRPVHIFAYPNGDFTEETAKLVEEAGFKAAFTVNDGFVSPGDDLFRLQRFGVNDWNIESFKRNLAAFF